MPPMCAEQRGDAEQVPGIESFDGHLVSVGGALEQAHAATAGDVDRVLAVGGADKLARFEAPRAHRSREV
jgi:hypothetical protein